MRINTADFMREFDKWVDDTKLAYDRALAATALDMFSGIVKLTPVDKGILRGNWQVQINSPASSEIDSDRDPVPPARTILSKYRGGSIYFSNNKPYAMTAEYGLWGTGDGATNKTTRDGYSVQAPYGMVRVTLENFTQTLKKNAEANKI